MKHLLTLILFCITINIRAQCTASYTQSTFPTSVLIIGATDEVCIGEDITINSYTTILIYGGGKLRIYNNSTFNLKGSLTVHPGGTIHLEDCGSKINIDGSYTGGNPNDCELTVYCNSCDSRPTSDFFTSTTSPAFLDVCCQAPLPVELLFFEAVRDGTKINFFWVTTSEINNHYFEVMVSNDGIVWDSAMVTPGSGSTNERNFYSVITSIGNYSYARLKQVDFDGTIDYSDIISLNSINTPISIVGNSIFVNSNKTETITVMDINGRILLSRVVPAGHQVINLTIKGVLFVRVGNQFIRIIL